MESKGLLQQVFGVMLIMLLLAGCSKAETTSTPELTVPAGTVKGRLVNANNKPVSGYNLKLLNVTGKEGDQLVLKALDEEVQSDKNGNFTFTDIESGKYVIVVLTYSPAAGQTTTFDLPQQVLKDKDGSVLIFELPQSEGIDLGIFLWDK